MSERTGSPPGLLQDDDRGLSRWLASKPDARTRVREVAAEIVKKRNNEMIDVTDRELLERAAKAAGIELQWDSEGVAWKKWPSFKWTPLTDDGDALRLAVKLCIDLEFDPMQDASIEAYRTNLEGSNYCADEPFGNDRNAATRRAIVRAAAQIGSP